MRRGRYHVLAFVLVALSAAPANADVADYLGRTIVDVTVQIDGRPVSDSALTAVIETRVGRPLTMMDVRETLAHLFGLGRYQDVQVDAVLRDQGVALTYVLAPALRVRRIVFQGALAVPEDELRRTVTDRFGAAPSLSRSPDVVAVLKTFYRDRGYPRAQIDVQSQPGRDQASASLVFAVRPGPRARIGTVEVQGAPSVAASDVLSRLDVHPGSEYDGVALEQKLESYAEGLRRQGFYDARVAHFARYVEDDRLVNVILSIEPGPHVEIVFQGDPLSPSERQALVPIARERSVDEDLLEDSKFAIERHFRQRGYCNPRADYQRRLEETTLRVVFTVTRGPQCVLERAEVTGNTSISSEELAPLIQMRAGQPFVDSVIDADSARIQSLYRQRGFAGIKVSPTVSRIEQAPGLIQVRVSLAIAEGPRSVIDSVALEGNAAVPTEVLRPAMTLAAGQPYFGPRVHADADSLGTLYLNRGYQEVTVRPEVKVSGDGSRVDVRFVIQEGPLIVIDHVLIVGNVRTRTETIAREVRLKSGQPLSQQLEDETRARLAGLGLFRRIDISYLQLPGNRAHRDLIVTVEEASVTTIAYGGGLEGGRRTVLSPATRTAVEEFQLAPRGFFGVTRRNLFGSDRSVNLFTRVSFRPEDVGAPDDENQPVADGGYGFNEYLVTLTFGDRRIFGTNADASFSAGVEQAARSSFSFNRRGANATVTRRVGRAVAISGRYSIDYTRLLQIKPTFSARPEIDRLFPQVRLSSVSSSLIRDNRNDPIEPSGGSLIGADVEVAGRSIGSQVGFVRTFFQGFTYRPLPAGRSTIAVFGGRLGLASGFPRVVTHADGATTTVDDLPASERFYAGGDTTVRGFALDRLGMPDTIDPDGFPQGGNGLVVLNAELRAPLKGSVGVVGFLDAGNVFRRVSAIAFENLRTAVGVGVRYRSPLGPIRLDVGIKLNRRLQPNGEREKPTALHISLGQAF